jgi:hypothetical protein
MQTQDGIVSPENGSIRHVGANRGVEWISSAFTMFTKKPGEFIVAGLLLFVATFILNFIPVVGTGLATMLGVVAVGAFMFACKAVDEGQDPIAAAQKAFNVTPLFILGLIAAGMGIAVGLLGSALLVMAVGMAFVNPFLGAALGALSGLLMMLISVPMVMALWLAPGLVVMKGTQPIEAIRLSFVASLKNFVPFIIFYLLAAVATFVGGLVIVGVIVVFPILLIATYMAYKDIFGMTAGGDGVSLIKDAP